MHLYAPILQALDHTLLHPTATWSAIQALCTEAMTYGVACVCIPPCYVARVKAFVGDQLPICTVIGFPNGYQCSAVKLLELDQARQAGADEFDLVINLGDLKNGDYSKILQEIKACRAHTNGKILKVIIEAYYLTQAEKERLCHLVTEGGADFIKTSTGFAPGGATLDDVQHFKQHLDPTVQIKAAGGIKTLAQAEAFLAAGATRLGSSSLLNLVVEARCNAHDALL